MQPDLEGVLHGEALLQSHLLAVVPEQGAEGLAVGTDGRHQREGRGSAGRGGHGRLLHGNDGPASQLKHQN